MYKDRLHIKPSKGEVNDLPSETYPEEVKEIRDIMAQFAKGMPIQQRTTHYFDEEDLSKITKFRSQGLDLTDLDQLQQQNQEMALAIENAKKRKEEEEENPQPTPEPDPVQKETE